MQGDKGGRTVIVKFPYKRPGETNWCRRSKRGPEEKKDILPRSMKLWKRRGRDTKIKVADASWSKKKQKRQ